jgi:hypothetical protein
MSRRSRVVERIFTPVRESSGESRLRSWNGRTSPYDLNTTLTPHNIIHGDACFAYFNKVWDIPRRVHLVLNLRAGGRCQWIIG